MKRELSTSSPQMTTALTLKKHVIHCEPFTYMMITETGVFSTTLYYDDPNFSTDKQLVEGLEAEAKHSTYEDSVVLPGV